MDDRILLEAIDFEKGTVTVEGKAYPMLDMHFPTVDPKNPLALTPGEKELMRTLTASFKHSSLLHKHVKFLYSHGGIYKCYNSNLLYHGCIPMNENGTFAEVKVGNAIYSGQSLMDYFNYQVQNAYFAAEGTAERQWAVDLMWYQ